MPASAHTALSCSECGLQAICLPPAVPAEELELLERLIHRSRPLQRGQTLFSVGEDGGAIHAVRSGAFKTTRLLPDGSELVTGFYLPGEVIGLDTLGHDRHGTTAIALETSVVCTLLASELETLARRIPSLQSHLFHLLGKEIRDDHRLLQLLAAQPAAMRLASFLLGLSQRQQRRRLPAEQLRLPMSRADLANHLGLALETASRQFSRLQEAGLLAVSGKRVDILDLRGLREVAGAQCE